MKIRMNVVVMTTLVILAGLVWLVARSQRDTIKTTAALPLAAPAPTPPAPKFQVFILPMPPAATPSVAAPLVIAPQPAANVAPVADASSDGATKHIAQPGETVTSMAADLLGKDTKTNRDAIINANASLQADPDKLVAGKSYRIPAATEVPAAPIAQPVQALPAPASPTPQPQASAATDSKAPAELKYTAAPGDTVANMAGAFLGNDDKTHQDTIVNANSSLQADPDRVVAGKAYRIPAPDGLSASAAPTLAQASPRPTTQPDADQVVVAGSPRTLRYTARSGDTVTNLAIELLGSDTQATRDAIINNNPELKRDPDRVIAGQTYWIPAPVAEIQNP